MKHLRYRRVPVAAAQDGYSTGLYCSSRLLMRRMASSRDSLPNVMGRRAGWQQHGRLGSGYWQGVDIIPSDTLQGMGSDFDSSDRSPVGLRSEVGSVATRNLGLGVPSATRLAVRPAGLRCFQHRPAGHTRSPEFPLPRSRTSHLRADGFFEGCPRGRTRCG